MRIDLVNIFSRRALGALRREHAEETCWPRPFWYLNNYLVQTRNVGTRMKALFMRNLNTLSLHWYRGVTIYRYLALGGWIYLKQCFSLWLGTLQSNTILGENNSTSTDKNSSFLKWYPKTGHHVTNPFPFSFFFIMLTDFLTKLFNSKSGRTVTFLGQLCCSRSAFLDTSCMLVSQYSR